MDIITDKQLFAFTQWFSDVFTKTPDEEGFKVPLGAYFGIHPRETDDLFDRCLDLQYIERTTDGIKILTTKVK